MKIGVFSEVLSVLEVLATRELETMKCEWYRDKKLLEHYQDMIDDIKLQLIEAGVYVSEDDPLRYM